MDGYSGCKHERELVGVRGAGSGREGKGARVSIFIFLLPVYLKPAGPEISRVDRRLWNEFTSLWTSNRGPACCHFLWVPSPTRSLLAFILPPGTWLCTLELPLPSPCPQCHQPLLKPVLVFIFLGSLIHILDLSYNLFSDLGPANSSP